MLARLPLLTGAALLLIIGCSPRERLNPFDPLNRTTGGRPGGFTAIAGDQEVRLHWQAVQGQSLIGYQLFRRGPGETEFQPITDPVSTHVSSFRDSPLDNGADYSYRLYFVFLSGLGALPAEDLATPGTARPWVIESSGTDLIRATPDARRVSERRSVFAGTADVAASPRDGAVWVADHNAGRVEVYQPVTGVTVSIPGLGRPRAVAVDPIDGTGWVCDVGRNVVYHFTAFGDQLNGPIAPAVQPVDVAVDPHDGSVWICELGAHRVAHFDADGGLLWRRSLIEPSRVAVDSTTRDGWVTSFSVGTVTRLSRFGDTLKVIGGFSSPLGVAVDWRRGRIWIADPGASSVVALNRDDEVEFTVPNLPDAGELSVDLGTGDAWVVLGAAGQLARVSAPSVGGAVRRLSGFRNPFAVSVDPGRQGLHGFSRPQSARSALVSRDRTGR